MLSIDCNLTYIMNYAHTYIVRSIRMLMNNQEIHEPAAQTSNTENAIEVNHNIQILER